MPKSFPNKSLSAVDTAGLEWLEARRMLAVDLAVTGTYTGGTFYPGMSVGGVAISELNVGPDVVQDAFATRLVLSTNRTYGDADDVEMAVVQHGAGEGPLGAGATLRREPTVTITGSVPSGSYYLMARIDSGGALDEGSESNNTWCSATANIVVARAMVTVAAPDQAASETGRNTGRFRVTRTGPTTSALVVQYSLGGSASADVGVDYSGASGTVTIPAGQAGANITITPVDDDVMEGPERVVLTLTEAGEYAVSATGAAGRSAFVNISDNDGPRIAIRATDATANEQDLGTATFTITRTNDVSGELTVGYTVGGTAAGNDYDDLAGFVTFADGERTATVTVTPVDDLRGEATETVVLTLVEDASYITVSGRRTARINIVDNEPVVKVLATDATASEDGNTATFTVSRVGSTSGALTVGYTLAGTATATGDMADFVELSGSVTIPDGQSSATIVVTPIADQIAEPAETVSVVLTAGLGFRLDAARNRAAVTIRDISPTVSVVASDATATETNTTTGTFTVSRTGATTLPLVVSFVVSGNATEGSDYVAIGRSVTIAAGQSAATVTVTPIDDSVGEGSETVILTLAAGTAYQRNTSRQVARINIGDNEPSVSVGATSAALVEGGGQTGTFTFTRTGVTTDALTVMFELAGSATVSGDGVVGADYSLSGTSGAGMVTIPARASSATVTITPINDDVAETTENVQVTITGTSGYVISPSRRTASISITDDEPTVSVTAFDANASETATDADPGTGTFKIARGTAGTSDLVVVYTIGGTATSGDDYAALTLSATIPAGATEVEVRVTPVDDSVGETDETVVLTLATNAAYNITTTAGRNRATVTIRDNEPVVRVQATDNTATEQDETTATFTFTRVVTDAQRDETLTVSYSVSGTADSGDDYEELDGFVEFAAGETTVTVTLAAIDDNVGEGNETVILTIDEGAGYSIDPTKTSGTVTITDNEPLVAIVATDAAASESGNNTGLFTVTRTGSTDDDLVVSFVVGGTATSMDDYAAIGTSVTIPAGASSATITVTPVYDLVSESAETVVVTLGTGDGYRVDPAAGRNRGTVTIANAPAVDLVVGPLAYRAGDYSLASTGVQGPLSFQMTNRGAAAAGLFRYEVRLSLNDVWGDDDDVVIWSGSQSGLDAGETASVSGAFDFDSVKGQLSAGAYRVACRVDSGLSVTEQSRTNNTWWSAGADFVVVA